MTLKKWGWAIEQCWLVKSVRYLGYKHDYYDGDFHCFGLWFWHFYVTNNPHCVYTEEEIKANIEAWYQAHPEHRPKRDSDGQEWTI